MDKHKSIWNTQHGCKKCSAGCQNCYMYFLDKMRGVGRASNDVYKLKTDFNFPLRKNRQGEYKVKPGERLNVNMTSDTFIEESDEWRAEMWKIIKQRSDVIFWLLTKRPERFYSNLPSDWGDGYPNVVMNITCENQSMYNKRIPYLLDFPAKHKGLCLAPLLSDIDISYALQSGQIEEVSVGGENYDNPRVCDFRWVKHVADTCREYHVNFCWYETGTKLLLDGYVHVITSKQKQATEAFFAGLNQKYYDVKYDLRYSDGSVVPKNEMYQKCFNVNHCLFCSNQSMCNGCTMCGNCGDNVELIDEYSFKGYQRNMLIKTGRFF